jgi:predicted patatin/cPLA2 family phospholipase
MPKEKTAFIASGGGMSCAYSAGVALALQETGIKPDIFIGSSGSAAGVSCFACGQAEMAIQLWELISDLRVIQHRPFRLNVDVIVDTMRDQFHLDESRLRDPHMDLYAATTDHRTMRTRYFSNHEPFDWHEVIRASMAIPFVYGKRIELDGRRYVDGDVVTALADSITFAAQQGARVIYVCDTRWDDSLFASIKAIGLRQLLCWDALKAFAYLYRQWTPRKVVQGVSLITFKPSHKLSTGMLNNSPEAVKEAIAAGYADAKLVIA